MIWQLVILQVMTFAILVFLLRQFLYRQVTQSQDRLERLVQENRNREQEMITKREAMEKEFKLRIADHDDEMGRLKETAENDAQRAQEETLARAQEEGKQIIADAEAQKERIRNQLVSEMEEKALNLASDIIERVFTTRVAQGIHAQLTDELIDEIERADGHGLQLDVDRIEVVVPFPLSELQKEKLKRIFTSKIGRSIEVKETIDQAIMTGMLVRLGDSVLDGSLKNKLKGAMTHVRGSLAR